MYKVRQRAGKMCTCIFVTDLQLQLYFDLGMCAHINVVLDERCFLSVHVVSFVSLMRKKNWQFIKKEKALLVHVMQVHSPSHILCHPPIYIQIFVLCFASIYFVLFAVQCTVVHCKILCTFQRIVTEEVTLYLFCDYYYLDVTFSVFKVVKCFCFRFNLYHGSQ